LALQVIFLQPNFSIYKEVFTLIVISECSHIKFKKGDLKVALVYPGKERVGLSSLAVHRIYSIINSANGVSCDILFSDRKNSLFLSLPPKEFDVLAFSITYENHLFEAIRLLYSWGIEPLREEREEGAPLILGGGIGLFYNPAPFMPIFDAIYLGEAEGGRLEAIFEAVKKKASLDEFENLVLTPAYSFEYDGVKVASISGEVKKIHRSKEFSEIPSHSCFLSSDTAFKDMFLIELNRGCVEKCRFCVASYMGLPYREKSLKTLEEEIKIASQYVDRVGLIGAGVTDYSKMEKLYYLLKKYGMKASFSSLKASSKSPYIFKIIEESGQKTITLAPEAATDRLRFAINKKVKTERYLEFAEKALQSGAENIKLYFLVGLPTETEEDIEAIAELAERFREIALPYWRERKRAGEIHLSVNPVIAKPFTPFQWYGLNPKSKIEKKLKKLSKLVRKIPSVKLSYESVREATIQAIISRGDDRIGRAAVYSIKSGYNLRKALKELSLPFEELYTREREREELLPWDFIDSGIKKDYLWEEYMKTYQLKPGSSCFPGCSICGLCPPTKGITLRKKLSDKTKV